MCYNRVMNETKYLNLLKWVWEINETYNLGIGIYKTSFNQEKQEGTWRCFGCSAEGISRWPDWCVYFDHDPDCKYVELKNLMEKEI